MEILQKIRVFKKSLVAIWRAAPDTGNTFGTWASGRAGLIKDWRRDRGNFLSKHSCLKRKSFEPWEYWWWPALWPYIMPKMKWKMSVHRNVRILQSTRLALERKETQKGWGCGTRSGCWCWSRTRLWTCPLCPFWSLQLELCLSPVFSHLTSHPWANPVGLSSRTYLEPDHISSPPPHPPKTFTWIVVVAFSLGSCCHPRP